MIFYVINPIPKNNNSLSNIFKFLSHTAIEDINLPTLQLFEMKNKARKDNCYKVFHDNLKKFETKNVLIKPLPQSSLPHLITVISSFKGECYIGWQMKHYPKSILEVTQLQNELSKFTDILPNKYHAAVCDDCEW